MSTRPAKFGVWPILVTSLTRRHFTPEGKIRSDLGPYAEAVKAVAAEKKVPVIDLYARSIESRPARAAGHPEFDPKPKEEAKAAAPDRTHLSPAGQRRVRCAGRRGSWSRSSRPAPCFRSP